ncbi:hypothetical protein Rleg5DRAFT_5760 [Rhizobium leguminosarum bv. viciae WSM1455]|nr:hypothetical protein Rleg5DRAFT_5760 [Rhizobium leguminosarum bv. viciae WSM1455]
MMERREIEIEFSFKNREPSILFFISWFYE